MRLAVAAVLLALTAAATLPVSRPEPITPLGVAFELYRGCMDGYYESAYVVPTKEDIRDYVISTDEKCILWMMIWYKPAFENGPDITEWPLTQIKLLNSKRLKFLTEYEDIMRTALLND